MAGIAVVLSRDPAPDRDLSRSLRAMLTALAHRGSAGEGVWVSLDHRAGLGHRRPPGAQVVPEPISDAAGVVRVTFDGALTNAAELRAELAGLGCATRTDAELLAAAYCKWGKDCLHKLVGSFAFALYDSGSRQLFCARDRMGAKPLYWAASGGCLYVASEAKALAAAGAVMPSLDTEALTDYLVLQAMMGERTLFSGIFQVPPAGHLTVGPGLKPEVTRYWQLSFPVDFYRTETHFCREIQAVVQRAVAASVQADGRWGAMLSGGIDSSLVTCLGAQALHARGRELLVFSGAYREGQQFDETKYASLVVDKIGSEWLKVYPTAEEFVEAMPRIAYFMDTPSGGPGVFGQFRMAEFASGRVQRVLSGEGGDETFLGYARYLIGYLEECLRGAIEETAGQGEFAATLATIIPNLPLLKTYVPMLQYFWQEGMFASPAQRYFRLLDRTAGLEEIYKPEVLAGRDRVFEEFEGVFEGSDARSMINKMQYFDIRVNLPALLQVDDRTTAAWGLDGCAPLLDHRLVELMATVPPTIKFHGGQTKYLLRKAARELVPDPIVQRKDKMGFPLPLDQWLRGPAREFVCDTLLSETCQQRSIFLPGALEKLLSRERPFGRALWGALCLELWCRTFLDGERPI